jgi:hypothetical protein
MQKILIISDDHNRSNSIRLIIENYLPYPAHIVSEVTSLKSQLERRAYSMCIVDVHSLDKRVLEWTEEIDSYGGHLSQIIVTTTIDNYIYTQMLNRADTHMLQHPADEKNILGLMRKLLVAKKVPKQQFQRFYTNQIAQIESLISGDNLLTSMYNLSKGGAYCEFDSKDSVSVGDIIRFKVAHSDGNKEYSLNAKVVWTTARGRYSGRFGCGFKFVSQSDIYGSMRF